MFLIIHELKIIDSRNMASDSKRLNGNVVKYARYGHIWTLT